VKRRSGGSSGSLGQQKGWATVWWLAGRAATGDGRGSGGVWFKMRG